MSTRIRARVAAAEVVDFGHQGGDPRRASGRPLLDLSTCVNRYGPPAAAIDVLRNLHAADILGHPYEAANRLEQAYAALLGVPAGELVAGRGTTEFIWALGRRVEAGLVAVPLPAYTDYLRVFPGRGFARHASERVPSIEQVDEALRAARLVIISNPHNPTGVLLDPADLVEVAGRHPASILVVDESYADFLVEPWRATVIGCSAGNVVALKSPSKFYGIAATRVGVAWCADRAVAQALFGPRETWPLSGIDVAVAEAALAGADWAAWARRQLAEDGMWLADALAPLAGDLVTDDVDVHFRCLFTPAAPALAGRLAEAGIGVRALGRAHGVVPGALRIVAPRTSERAVVARGVEAAACGRGHLRMVG